jgi:hypothetical protein
MTLESPAPRDPTPRPAAPKVFGVLSIIFGSLVLVMSLGSGCMSTVGKGQMGQFAALGSKKPQQVAAAFERFQSATRLPTMASTAVFIAMSAGLILVGIGQVRYARWGRGTSLVWSAVALVALAAVTAMNLLVLRPAMLAYFDEIKQLSSGIDALALSWTSSLTSSPWMQALSVLFYAPYPLLLLFFFSSRRIKEAMTA